ncbi:MAG: hypothetical protein ACKVX7_14700 [Planctomycetota bacterium]
MSNSNCLRFIAGCVAGAIFVLVGATLDAQEPRRRPRPAFERDKPTGEREGAAGIIPLLNEAMVQRLRVVERGLARALYDFERARVALDGGSLPGEALASDPLETAKTAPLNSLTAAREALRDALSAAQLLHDDAWGGRWLVPGGRGEQLALWLAELRSHGSFLPAEISAKKNTQDLGQDHCALSEHLAVTLRDLPAYAHELYEQDHGLRAAASYERALANGDGSRLLACALRFPIASQATLAALLASEIFLEAGDYAHAGFALDFVVIPDEPTSDEPDGIEAQAARAALSRQLAASELLLACLVGDARRYRRAADLLGAEPHTLPEFAALPGIEQFDVKRRANGVGPPADIGGTAGFPYRSSVFRWESVPFRTPALYGSRDVRYAPGLVIDAGKVIVNTPRHVSVYDLVSGSVVAPYDLPLARTRTENSSMSHSESFLETDKYLRFYPRAATVLRGQDEIRIHLGSYVASFTGETEYAGYYISRRIPQRALVALHGPTPIWDTGESRRVTAFRARPARGAVDAPPPPPLTNPHAEFLARASFNSQPLVYRGRVYALAWEQSGYVNAHLVCLELATGRVQWSTLLAGNQVDLTMFGEIQREPFMGALAEQNGVIYALTNLGVIAAVNCWDGSVRWLTTYENLMITTARQSLRFQKREVPWDRNPLVICFDRLFATPLDSEYLFAFELKTGRLLQSAPARMGSFLLGLDGASLVFCSGQQAALVSTVDIQLAPRFIALGREVRSRPALIPGGLVCASDKELFYTSLTTPSMTVPLGLLHRSPTVSDQILDGAVHVVDSDVAGAQKRVLVLSSDKLSCYELEAPK